MTLRLFNSLTREKQDFVPRTAGVVRMYVCGMTVYDFCHIGHARVLVVFDLVAKWLRKLGFQLTYVRNITDVDDKILRQAALNDETPCQLAHRFIGAMHQDCEALGVAPPDYEPRATEYVEAMVRMIRALEKKGVAYQGADGDVYYSVRLFPTYGRLSGKSLDQLRAGERVQVAADKNDPLDFVLWKKAKEGEMHWPSPWGPGRPGWHIECSAMSSELLGEYFDIHGGGQDLKFPHHENEIAQSDGAFGHSCVNYWLHNGFVQVDGNKMSKSLGNFFTIREVLKRYPAEVLRYFILRTHYRSPLNFSDAHLDEAQQGLRKLYTSLSQHPVATIPVDWTIPAMQKFRKALNDDFNTPDAMVVLFELAASANHGDAQAAGQLRALGQLLGLLGQEPREFLQLGAVLPPEEIERQISERRAARAARDFKLADDIRQRLLSQGIVVEDNAQGTQWRRL